MQKSSIEYWHYQQNSFEPIAKQIERKEQHSDKTEYKTYYTVTDHIGTPRELFTDNGDIAWRGYYGTWGQVQTDTTYTKQETDCNLRYAGQYCDKESGLHYNRYRYYDPESSQYLSSDPIGLLGGLTPQSYVHNPNGWVDPLGLAKGKSLCPTGAAQKASDLPVLKPGSKDWKDAVDSIKNAKGHAVDGNGHNFRVKSQREAKQMIQEAYDGKIPHKKPQTGGDFGYEYHRGNETGTVPFNNDLQHIKWYDWRAGKNGADGHIFFDVWD